MTSPLDLSTAGFLRLRGAVAQIIAGPTRQGVTPEVTGEHLLYAENLIQANVLDVSKIIKDVR